MKPLYLTIILTITFSGIASAAIKPVQVKDTDKTRSINAEVVNIASDTQIDTTAVLTDTDKANIKKSFNFTDKEAEVQDKILAGTLIDPNDMEAYVAGLQKMNDKRGLSGDEVNDLFMKGKTAQEAGKYLYSKEKQEIKL